MATKPMVGCLDAVSHTGEAVREMAGGLASGDVALAPRRSRFPQPFGLDGRMVPFEHPAAARRSERFAVRGDLLAPADLWMSLRLPVRQRSSVPAEKLRPIPQAFEMDAVVWRPGPIAPKSDLGSGWLIAARVSALEAPNELIRWVFDYTDYLNLRSPAERYSSPYSKRDYAQYFSSKVVW